MNNKIVSYVHLIHTIFINTYFLFDITLVPIWIIHMTVVVLSWGFTNYTCPMTILEHKTADTDSFDMTTIIKPKTDANLIERLSFLTTTSGYKKAVLSWFISLIFYGFWYTDQSRTGVSYVIVLAKSLYLIGNSKYKTALLDISLNRLYFLFCFYCSMMVPLVSYVLYVMLSKCTAIYLVA